MSITINKRPHRISSSSNNNIWSVSSDIPTLVYLMVIVKEAVTGGIVAQKKVYRKPNQQSIQFDVSDILINLGESVLVNNNNFISTSTLPSYKIEIEEWFVNLDIITTAPKYIDNQTHYFFESSINDIDYLTYTSNLYNLNANDKAKFLSNGQAIKKVSTQAKEVLKIFNVDSIVARLKVSCYDGDGDFLKDVVIDLPMASVYTLNASPSVLLNHPDIKDSEEENFIGIYKVVLINSANEEISESKIYQLYEEKCSIKQTHIVYKNSVGGWDSIKFNNRVETISITKSTMNKFLGYNPIADDGKYFNSKQNINTTLQNTYTATSDLLDDVDSKLMKELLLSNKVYVVLGQYLIEIYVDTNKYKVLQRHTYGGKKARFEVSFSSPISIEKLDGMLEVSDIPLNNNPDASFYLSASGDFVIDGFLRSITLKY